MQFFDQRETLAEKVQIVVNRLGLEDSQISVNKALETIGREISWQIPNDYATMVDSRNNGVPLISLAPKAKVTKALEKMARSFDGNADKASDAADEKKPRKGLFGFLSSK
jgi:pilus assembly protein CpaE